MVKWIAVDPSHREGAEADCFYYSSILLYKNLYEISPGSMYFKFLIMSCLNYGDTWLLLDSALYCFVTNRKYNNNIEFELWIDAAACNICKCYIHISVNININFYI